MTIEVALVCGDRDPLPECSTTISQRGTSTWLNVSGATLARRAVPSEYRPGESGRRLPPPSPAACTNVISLSPDRSQRSVDLDQRPGDKSGGAHQRAGRRRPAST